MIRAKASRSPQAKVLRGVIFRKTILYFLIFTGCFAGLAAWANAYLVPDLANCIADTTSSWTYYKPEQYDALVYTTPADELAMLDMYSTSSEDGTLRYAIRDLTTYHLLRSLKIPCALCLYFIGIVIISFYALNKALEYFDTLTSSVAQILADTSTPVSLPEDLSIVQSELNEIKANTRAAQENTKREEERKNELVAYLAHNIKTPLTSILGYLSLLKEAPDLPEDVRKHYASIALEKSEHLEALIDEFFEITRYNLQSIPIEREHLDIALFCEQIAEEFYPEAQRNEVSIVVDAPEQTTVFADPVKFARAVSNVMRNALAYADPYTEIKLEAKPTPKGIVVSIENTGKEISPSHLQSIFEKFFREDQARTTNQGGAGLGLAIAKEIMLAHGGTITAHSEAGKTTFCLFLPN